MNKQTIVIAVLLASLVTIPSSDAFLTQLGDGDYLSHLVINFSDGGIYEFDVRYSDLMWTGKDLLDFVEQSTDLETVQNEFEFGGGPVFFLDGISFDGRSNSGFGGGDDWWRYWIRDGETGEWESPAFGFSDRTISDGSWDGWVYGSANPPVLIPEPGTAWLLAGGMMLLGWMRRRG